MAVMNKNLQQAINRTQILRKILERKEISRAELARELGMYRSTVSNLVDNLLKDRWIVEAELKKSISSPGRRAQSLSINKQKGIVLGLAFRKGNNFDIVVTDFTGEILYSESGCLSTTSIEEGLTKEIDRILQRDLFNNLNILGMGVSIAGLIDTKNQILIDTKNPIYRNVTLNSVLKEEYNFPIFIENDSRCCAWGKAWTSHRFEKTSFVYVYMTGVLDLGMGLYVDGEILNGANNHSGEFSKRFESKAKKRFDGLIEKIAENHESLEDSTIEQIDELIEEFLDMIFIIDPAFIYLGYEFEGFPDILGRYMDNGTPSEDPVFTEAKMGPGESAFGAACFFLYQLYKSPESSLLTPFRDQKSF